MSSGKLDPSQFFLEPGNVGLFVSADDVFGLLNRSLDLPSHWGALVRRTAGDHQVIPASGTVKSADTEDVFFVRLTPIEAIVHADQLVSRDGFPCEATVSLRVAVIPEQGELLALQRNVLGSQRAIAADGISRHLASTVRSALATYVSNMDGATLVGGREPDGLAAELADALKAPLFTAGLMLAGDVKTQFESAAVQRVQQVESETTIHRAQYEARRELQRALEHAQREHADHLVQLLGKLQRLAATSPDTDLAALIRTFSDEQRCDLYDGLFAHVQPARRTRWIAVAAGNELLFYEPDRSEQPVRRVRLDGVAGVVRSVQYVKEATGAPALWLGAATGVYRLPMDASSPDVTFCAPAAREVRGGFNSVAVHGGSVLASHSELGMWTWNRQDGTAQPVLPTITRSAKTVRDVQVLGDEVFCAVDDRVICWKAGEVADAPHRMLCGCRSAITALRASADGVVAGTAAGDVQYWATGSDNQPETLHRGDGRRAVESIWVTQTNGIRRLFFTDTTIRVHGRVLGDRFTCGFEAGGQTIRRVEVAPDLLVGTTDLRDRLFLWSPHRPDAPRASIAVSSMCGRSIQDICLVSEEWNAEWGQSAFSQ